MGDIKVAAGEGLIMGTHKWQVFSNPRNSSVSVVGCVMCGALKGSAAEKRGGPCVATPLQNNPLLKMGWTVVDPLEAAPRAAVNA